MSEAGQSPKSVFEYTNYREFVRDYYLALKAKNKLFSYRVFSRLAGFKSSNFIKFVIDGKSNVSPKSAAAFASAMKLGPEETRFFKTLVLFNQATRSEERANHAKALMSSNTYRENFPLNEALFGYVSKWFYVVLRSAVALKEFHEDPAWLSKKFIKNVNTADIERGIQELVKLGLLKREESGKLVQANANVTSGDEVTSSAAAQFHRQMMSLASESIDRVPRDRRDISAMTVGVSPEIAQKIKAKVQEFRKEIVEMVSTGAPTNSVYQLNIQFFPVFDLEEAKKK